MSGAERHFGPSRAGVVWLRSQLTASDWESAGCTARPDLAWTADAEPTRRAQLEMAQVCASCPVMVRCADYALDERAPAAGGFYAGLWLPWRTDNGHQGSGYRSRRNELARRLVFWKTGAVRLTGDHSGRRQPISAGKAI